MKDIKNYACPERASKPRFVRRLQSARATTRAASIALTLMLSLMLLLPGFALNTAEAAAVTKRSGNSTTTAATKASVKTATTTTAATTRTQDSGGQVYTPTARQIMRFEPLDFAANARQEALEPSEDSVTEIRAIDAPRGDPPQTKPVPMPGGGGEEEVVTVDEADAGSQAPLPSASGVSPGPSKSFKGEYLSGTNIPPDTMGAVGDNHVMNVTNNSISIQTRDGVQISRQTLNAFWAGVPLEGGAAASTFDPKILYDRFNDRWIFISSANAQTLSSAALFAVSATSDPTGLWYRYAVDADPTATAAGGLWIDYPTIGHNKKWIVVNENTFGYGTLGGGYLRADIYVLDKHAAYNNTLGTISHFSAAPSSCVNVTDLGCGFTIAPTIVEDNTTEEVYFAENWNSTSGQLRISKLTGTAAAPILTVGTQFPQSPFSWRFNAARIDAPTGGGYVPQRNQNSYVPSTTRLMANDARMQNAVLRNGTLWCTHTVMLAATPTAANVAVGGAANPDVRAAVQWWQIDQTIENSMTSTPPLQRGRIEDPIADNCHNGSGATRTTDPTCATAAMQKGEHFAYPNISVNQNNDVLIGFTKFSALSYPNAGYAMRLAADAPNTTRDPVVYRAGQANHNLGAGAGTAASPRQNRWGDYSASMVDPLNDIDFWTVQEYSGTRTQFAIFASPWETYWAQVKPSTAPASTSGTLIINEFRLRGPDPDAAGALTGTRDEFVELYNPSDTPIIVQATDNTEGWSLGYSDVLGVASGVAVIPNGTVIPGRSYYLIANNPDAATGAGAPGQVYSLNGHPNVQPSPVSANPTVRGADSDTGYGVDLADNGGIAIFTTANPANYTAVTRMDSVGFSSLTLNPQFREGTGLADIAGTPTGQLTWVRNVSTATGRPQDTNDNAADFLFLNPVPTDALTAPHRHGVAGPQNIDSPLNRMGEFGLSLADRNVSASLAPNRVRRSCADPLVEECDPNRSALGTFSFRRFAVNNTGQSVSRLRFRIVDLTTRPAPAGTSDLRVLSAPDINVTTTDQTICNGAAPCTVPLKGMTLEEPPAQSTFGGGLNTTVSAGTITLANRLAPSAHYGVHFLLGVQQGGSFRFLVIVEALP